ncbi:MAG: carbamoyltransferase [Chromatiaceae bacterium]|nr:carbamoyltransferase [Chromatiaceae bacterium]
MNVILGFNAFHADSAACLVVDGQLVGAVAEERLGERQKHSPAFPAQAIRRLLADAGLRLADVTHVALARDPKANRAAKMAYVAQHPLKAAGAVIEHLRRNRRTQGTLEQLAEVCDEDPARVRFETVSVEHHLAHIASAYYLSPFEDLTAGFSYDASGDFASMMAARCEGTRIEVLDRVTLPHSLGFFYTALCQFIGFDEFGEEYKVMGLAPYGQDRYGDLMRELVRLDDRHWYRLAPDYFGMHAGGESGAVDETRRILMGRFYTDRLSEALGAPRRRADPLTQREKDIARSTQIRFEEAAMHCLTRLQSRVPTRRLAMAGGCALNGVANARIQRETPFKEHYLQAAASDDGTCLGAAFYCWHTVLGRSERFHMQHAFWGPGYSDDRIRTVAEASGFAVRVCADEPELVEAAAGLIADGLVTGWYQGRGEWGPRALGNRSILANPAIPTMKDTLNAKIKRRESFRPFAPSVLKEMVPTYFEQRVDSPFMMHVVKIRHEWRDRLPAVTHVDGTGRLQTVDRASNPLYYQLIDAFRRKTGVGMVLNTSFNENEPIVDTPEQALDCFKRTDMDALCLGRYLLLKSS